MTVYSDAVAAAKAKVADGAKSQREIGELAISMADPDPDADFYSGPGGADVHTTGGGNATPHQDFSEIVAQATHGVDGEGDKPGKPAQQQPTKEKVGGDVVTKDYRHFAKVEKIEHGVVFGWAIICKQDGVEYYDLNRDPETGQPKPDHIPEASMLDAACDFAKAARPGNEMHAGPEVGQYLFLFPMTTDIAKALGITTKNTGLLVGYKPPDDVLAKFADGTYTGFSIEGSRIIDKEFDDGEA